MRRRDLLAGAGMVAAGLALPMLASRLRAGAGGAPPGYGFQGRALGTDYRVALGVRVDPPDLERVHAHVGQVLAHIDSAMSTFRPDSEISQVNAAAPGTWVTVSDDTALTLDRAQRLCAGSEGAFDPTIGPLVALWGFGPAGPRGVPSDAEVAAARDRVNAHAVELDSIRRRVRRLRGDAHLDLCGIGKGRAVDRIAEVLQEQGFDRYLVDVGGELLARGERPGGGPWRVGIERLPGERGDALRVLALEDRAVATSGDYRSYFVQAGRRYSHCLDPRSGRPVNHGLCAVSVVAGSALAADALSTALMVLGPEAGLELADRWQVAARLVTRVGDRYREQLSERFAMHVFS
jgi:thiamine biosynthesis lipoprotein